MLKSTLSKPWWSILQQTFKQRRAPRHLSTLSDNLQTLHNAVLKEQPARLELSSQADTLWKTPNLAKSFAAISQRHNDYHRIQSETNDLLSMQTDLGIETTPEEATWIQNELKSLENELDILLNTILFNQPSDTRDCWIELSAGAGGDDAMDFTEMLSTMYLKWGERHNFTISLEDVSHGDVAGYRTARLSVSGDFSSGWLCSEVGIHRLIRNSPFNKSNTRETSFARVDLIPKVSVEETKTTLIAITPEDVEIQTYKSGGKGGQHANTTDSAVRMTHIETGTVATSSKERSQHANKKHCFSLLRGKLLLMQENQEKDKKNEMHSKREAIAFGSHFRTYQLSTGMLKDNRSGYECSDPGRVLNGDGLQDVLISGLHCRKNVL